MKENEKNIPPAEEDDDKIHVSKSVFQTAKDIQQQRMEELKRQEEELQRKLAEREKKRREAYDKRILEEKKELLRLKQGAIEESETIREEKPEEIKLSFWGKIKNFFYHNKWWLGLGVFFVAVGVFLIHNLLSKEHPDITVMIITNNNHIGYSEELDDYIGQFTEDVNDNGEVLAQVMYIPYSENYQTNYAYGVDTKLTVQLQSADSMIIIGGALTEDIMDPSETLIDLEELFPDNPHVDGHAFYLKDTKFAERLGISGDVITDDLFIAFRKPQRLLYADADEMQEAYERELPVLMKIIEDLS